MGPDGKLTGRDDLPKTVVGLGQSHCPFLYDVCVPVAAAVDGIQGPLNVSRPFLGTHNTDWCSLSQEF